MMYPQQTLIQFANSMIYLLLARFALNDLPHAAGLLSSNPSAPSETSAPPWVRRASIPELLVHYTPKWNLPAIQEAGYLSPKVSAIGKGDRTAIEAVQRAMPFNWEDIAPVEIPPTENYKFKRVLYPDTQSPLMASLLAARKLETVNYSTAIEEYGQDYEIFVVKHFYGDELELVSMEPVYIDPHVLTVPSETAVEWEKYRGQLYGR